jgi:tetratricopeptide (TPR) repeat protein
MIRRKPARAAAPAGLSLAMIARDEVQHLGRALASVAGLVDEAVVVDTGSRDGTDAMARRHGARVIAEAWTDNFSAARNRALAEARGPWVLVLDADEELVREDQAALRHALACPAAEVFDLPVLSRLPGGGVGRTALPRLFRKAPGVRYAGAIHEQLVHPGRAMPLAVRILHHGYDGDPAALQAKFARNLRILEAGLGAAPEDPVLRYHLAQTLLSRGRFVPALRHAEAAAELAEGQGAAGHPIKLMALNQLAILHLNLGNPAAAIAAGERAAALDPEYVDPLLALGRAYLLQGQPQAAREVLERFLRVARAARQGAGRPGLIQYRLGSDCLALSMLGQAHRGLGDPRAAEEALQAALEANPDHWPAWAHLSALRLDEGRPADGLEALQRGVRGARAAATTTGAAEGLYDRGEVEHLLQCQRRARAALVGPQVSVMSYE